MTKEPQFVPRPCAVCGEPNTLEHRCDYQSSNLVVELRELAEDYATSKFDCSHTPTKIRQAADEIERLTRERDDGLERIGKLQLVGSQIAAERDRLRATLERIERQLQGYAEFSPADELRRIAREALRPDELPLGACDSGQGEQSPTRRPDDETVACKHNNQRQGERGPAYCADCGAQINGPL